MSWLFHLYPPILIQTLFKEGVVLDIENYVAGTILEHWELEDCLLYMCLFVLLVPAAWLILESWWTQGTEHQLQWLFSVVPLVSEVFFAGHSLFWVNRVWPCSFLFFLLYNLNLVRRKIRKSSCLFKKNVDILEGCCVQNAMPSGEIEDEILALKKTRWVHKMIIVGRNINWQQRGTVSHCFWISEMWVVVMALSWEGDPIQLLELVLGLVSGMAGPARGPGLPKWIVEWSQKAPAWLRCLGSEGLQWGLGVRASAAILRGGRERIVGTQVIQAFRASLAPVERSCQMVGWDQEEDCECQGMTLGLYTVGWYGKE